MTAALFGTWVPRLDTSILDQCMDNAMRRVSGSVGLDISMDKGRLRTLKDTAANALEAGMSSPGPFFMRVGQGVLEAGLCKIGSSLDPKEVGAELLYEFHSEATAAFQSAKAALSAEALGFLREKGVDKAQSQRIIAAADAGFSAPGKEVFTRVGLPFVKSAAAPSTQALVGGLAGLILVLALVRSPHLGVFTGVLTGGGAYYLARRRMRQRCENILRLLPRNLYDMLATEWNANIRRYAETVNARLLAAH